MMKLETAIEKCFDRMNISGEDESTDIYKFMFRYKAIRELPAEEMEEVYNKLSKRLGFC